MPLNLFEECVNELEHELEKRRQQLLARKGDIARLQQLTEHLVARGWNARADVSTHLYGGAILRLWINVTGRDRHVALLEALKATGIEIARQQHADIADTYGYELLVDECTKIVMRVGIAPLPVTREAA